MRNEITVDMTPGLSQPILYYSQNDVGTELVIKLKGVDIPAGATITLRATKPSGFGFIAENPTVSGNTVTFITTEDMTDEYGRFPAELNITSGGVSAGTANFIMAGEKNPHPNGTTDGSAEEVVPELTQLVERVEDAASSVLDRQTVTNTLPAGSQASYSFDEETNTQTFGIPQGEAGAGAIDVTASAYSSSKTYAVGDYVIHNDYLYRCTTAITTAEAWTSGHWTQVLLVNEVSDVKSDLTHLKLRTYVDETAQSGDKTYSVDIDIKEKGTLSLELTNENIYSSGWYTISFYNGADKVSSDKTYLIASQGTQLVSDISITDSVTSIVITNTNNRQFGIKVYSYYADEVVQTIADVVDLKKVVKQGLYYPDEAEPITVTQTQGYYLESTVYHTVIANDTDEYSYKAVVNYDSDYIYYVTLQTALAADCILYADADDYVIGKDLERIPSTLISNYKLTVPDGCAKIYITTNRAHNIEVSKAELVLLADAIGGLIAEPSNVLKVSTDGAGDFRNVQSAIDAASEGDTIIVYPGTYPRFSNYTNHKELHIVGVDKNSCIIYDDSSDYRTPPVEWCNGSISNLTIIEDHSNPDDSLQTGDDTDGKDFNLERAYSIHIDGYYAANKYIRIENCIIKNTKRCAIGMGLKQSNTVEIINCDIWSGVPTRSLPDSEIKRGAWYVHNSNAEANVTGQKLVAANNRVYCDDNFALYIGDFAPSGYTNECEMTFINNLYYSEVNGSNSIVINGVAADWAGKNIDLGGSSYGNNASVLNA